jgi:hypothetical protein
VTTLTAMILDSVLRQGGEKRTRKQTASASALCMRGRARERDHEQVSTERAGRDQSGNSKKHQTRQC